MGRRNSSVRSMCSHNYRRFSRISTQRAIDPLSLDPEPMCRSANVLLSQSMSSALFAYTCMHNLEALTRAEVTSNPSPAAMAYMPVPLVCCGSLVLK